jgi:hypothetical protein
MTLLDAPKFDAARDRRRRIILWSCVGALAVLFVGFWLAAGHPVDWPWNWLTHLRGRATINRFLTHVERNELEAAYGVWIHDPEWQKHPNKSTGAYDFARFQQDWSPTSSQNEYGAIRSHEIVAARMAGNVLLVGIRINGLKSKPLFLNYDPQTRQLGFSPVELYLGP